MAQRSLRRNLQRALDRIRKIFRREDQPGADPYAYVTAPKKPRPPYRSAAVAEEEP
jgi:hypothetical protein